MIVAIAGYLINASLLTTSLEHAMPAVFVFARDVAQQVTGPFGAFLALLLVSFRFARDEEEAQRGNTEDNYEWGNAKVWIGYFILAALMMHTTEIIMWIHGIAVLFITADVGGLVGVAGDMDTAAIFPSLDALADPDTITIGFDAVGTILFLIIAALFTVLVLFCVYIISWIMVYGLFFTL
jgi:hypothetical protein